MLNKKLKELKERQHLTAINLENENKDLRNDLTNVQVRSCAGFFVNATYEVLSRWHHYMNYVCL